MSQIIECPRDAMQGIKPFIPTRKKSCLHTSFCVWVLIRSILEFCFSKAIPQMVDTAAVLDQLDLSQTTSKLLAIMPN
jgi:hydroxymethylglutaryl-CoA lyase